MQLAGLEMLHPPGFVIARPGAQDGSLSVWRRHPGQLTYSLAGSARLTPPPSRLSNNAVVSLLQAGTGMVSCAKKLEVKVCNTGRVIFAGR
jgi:hypothetical protein